MIASQKTQEIDSRNPPPPAETPKVYDPKQIEEKWSDRWAKQGRAGGSDAQTNPSGAPFSIVMPPPNVTGALHVGHALNNTLQDILVRWRRMRGDDVLWIPGTDHAGIATQNVVERQLAQQGESRHDLTREAFIQRVWEWKAQSGGTIIGQLKRLGVSCNWERECFTMDEGLSRAVREVFVRLHSEGLIYRAKRLIHWCTRCRTALSDIEVEHEEVDGLLYHIAYPIADRPGKSLTVATTRPETMLGDTAVAVHPEDPWFNQWIGHAVRLPLTQRTIPVIGDAILVDREFGTGAVKVTPGHDFNDEAAGKRHGLPILSLFTPDGTLSKAGLASAQISPEYAAVLSEQTVLEVRARVVAALKETGALLASMAHRHAVGKCYRCRTVVEPYGSLQWFVRVNDPANPLATPAMEAVRSRRIRLIPESWEANYFGWMKQIQDWCISRQIWWGHPIPAWYCRGRDVAQCHLDCKEPIVAMTQPTQCPHCGSADFEQDPDVLDTWFSSALWPFSTLGWPATLQPTSERQTDAERMLARFYPTTTLVTSFDILFFWVARMIMMGLHFMKEVPFRTVYLHPLVRDAEGKKMSKSKGNVIDPLAVMRHYGTDALRFTFAATASPGRDIRLSEERIEGYRNFANKIWNAARFIQMNASTALPVLPFDKEGSAKHPAPPQGVALSDATSPAGRWIRARLRQVAEEVNGKLSDFRFDEAATAVYRFVWHEFCDWYLELVKVDLQDAGRKETACRTMWTCFGEILKLLHPFMPFITEELGQTFGLSGEGRLLATLPYPTAENLPDDGTSESTNALFTAWVIEPVTAIRNLRGEMNISPSEVLPAFLKFRNPGAGTESAETAIAIPDFASLQPYVTRLARLSHVTLNAEPPVPSMTAQTTQVDIFIPLSEAQRRAEIDRLEKELAKMDREWAPLEKKLADPNFLKAPLEVQEKHRARARAMAEKRSRIEQERARLFSKICG